MKISIIIPVRNGGEMFRRCLRAIAASPLRPHEVIVADDGSTDDTVQLATAAGAQVVTTPQPGSGPAVARNLAAQRATGVLLFFCDSDVEINPDTLAHITQIFEGDPTLTALFGSYDDAPSDPGFISQYKNLFHHYVHQHGAAEASTFWSGCGVITREGFLECGGFSSSYTLPSIEDIELGSVLKSRGYRIRLEKSLQVKHLKHWTLLSLLHSDIFARGLPWTRLLLRSREFLNDLNLQTHNRSSVVVTYLMILCLALSLWQPFALMGVPLAVFALLWMNQHLYQFFYQKRGFGFMLGALGMHWLYYFYNGLSFSLGFAFHVMEMRFDKPTDINSVSMISVASLLLLATFVRFHNLGAQSMWLDELLEINLARRSWSSIISGLLYYAAMPLDYFVTHDVLLLGDQDFWLRVAPAFWSLLTVAVIYRFVGQYLGRWQGVSAAAVLTIARFHIRYAQETRPYALFGLLALVSLYFFFRALKTNRLPHWIGYAISTSLCLLTHFFTLFIIGAQALIFLIEAFCLRPPPRFSLPLRFGASLVFVFLVFALTPYLTSTISVGEFFFASFLNPQSFNLDPALKPNQDIGPVLDPKFFSDLIMGLSGGGVVWSTLFVGLAVVGVLALIRGKEPEGSDFGHRRERWPSRVGLPLLIWTIIPPALTIAFLIHRGTFFADRYLMPSYITLIILIAIGLFGVGQGLATLAPRFKMGTWALVVLIPLALNLILAHDYYGEVKEDWRMAGQFIAQNFSPGDTVVSPEGGFVIFHYAARAENGKLDAKLPAQADQVRGRLWFVVHPYLGPTTPEWMKWLSAHESVEYRIDDSIRVFVLNAPSAETLARVTPPEVAPAWASLAAVYEKLGDPIKTNSSYQRAIVLSPKPQFQIAYADYLRRHGSSDQAATYYLNVLRIDPSYVPALIGMGRIYMQRNLLEEARVALERAIALAPDDYAANLFLSELYDRVGRDSDAVPYRNRASQIVPDLIEPP